MEPNKILPTFFDDPDTIGKFIEEPTYDPFIDMKDYHKNKKLIRDISDKDKSNHSNGGILK